MPIFPNLTAQCHCEDWPSIFLQKLACHYNQWRFPQKLTEISVFLQFESCIVKNCIICKTEVTESLRGNSCNLTLIPAKKNIDIGSTLWLLDGFRKGSLENVRIMFFFVIWFKFIGGSDKTTVYPLVLKLWKWMFLWSKLQHMI